ncbi:MAG: hypothetical protein ACYDG2_14255 [Ruminiclostridium sp.]
MYKDILVNFKINCRKKLLAVFLVISILVFTSCSDSTTNDNGKKEVSDSKPLLKIYHMNFDLQLKETINRFNSSNNKVTVMATEFQDAEEYRDRITTETLVGEGPDIFVGYDFFKSAKKAISSGVFCDLNELILKDKKFKLSNTIRIC